MPKLKTHSGAAKRFTKTASGKFKRGQSKMRHILTSKSVKTKRHLAQGRPDLRGGYPEDRTHAALRVSGRQAARSFQVEPLNTNCKGPVTAFRPLGGVKPPTPDLKLQSE